MTQFDKAFFLDRFKEFSVPELIQHALERELTQEAERAIRQLLAEHGMSGDRLELAVLDVQRERLAAPGVTNQCDYCGRGVMLGAIRSDGRKFCGDRCLREFRAHRQAFNLSPELIREHALGIVAGECPRCGGMEGLVEMRPVESCISLLVVYFPEISAPLICRKCFVRSAIFSTGMTLVLGWWSFQGLFATPRAMWRNIRWVYRDRFDDIPSPELLHFAALDLAERLSGLVNGTLGESIGAGASSESTDRP